jgi:hypothetical protein
MESESEKSVSTRTDSTIALNAVVEQGKDGSTGYLYREPQVQNDRLALYLGQRESCEWCQREIVAREGIRLMLDIAE